MIEEYPTFRTASEVEEILQLRLLSRIELQPVDSADPIYPSEVFRYPRIMPSSSFSSSIDLLRSEIQRLSGNGSKKVVQLTSTLSGEGKTTLCVALATSAANAGLRVLLIDGSVRRPRLAQRVRIENTPGLSGLLLGKASFKDVIRYSNDFKCMIMVGGAPIELPIDLFDSERFASILDSARNQFDYVVIDTPPAGRVADAFVVSEFSDHLVYVVRWGSTPQIAVRHHLKNLSRYASVSGVVLNQVIPEID
jgi:capsular exopolysaccharide synthesis family protein